VSLDAQLRECGVVGAGGAGFPTYVKAQAKVEFVIANGPNASRCCIKTSS